MPDQKADPHSDVGLKPFNPNKGSGESEGAPTEVKTFDLDSLPDEPEKKAKEPSTEVSEEQKKSDEHGQRAVDNFSKQIQEKSEELYGIDLNLAMKDPSHIDKLLEGSSKDKKMAEKILERNAEHFEAATPDEYQLNKKKAEAGDDPVKQKLAEIDHQMKKDSEEKKKSDWKAWKKDNSVEGEAVTLADQIHSDHPDMDFGLVMAAVKGLSKGERVTTKEAVATGAVPPGEEGFDTSSPIAKALLKNVDVKATKKFAKEGEAFVS